MAGSTIVIESSKLVVPYPLWGRGLHVQIESYPPFDKNDFKTQALPPRGG